MHITFISDNFYPEYMGGGELSLQALIETCPYDYRKVSAKDILGRAFDKSEVLVFSNFTHIPGNALEVFKDKQYFVIECDFKYCEFRNPVKHKEKQGKCDCHKGYAKPYVEFFKHASKVVYKSQKQFEIYLKLFPHLGHNAFILGSTFSTQDLMLFDNLRHTPKDNKYFIFKTDNWLKGYGEAVSYCNTNRLPMRCVGNNDRKSFLKLLAGSKGLVFMPTGLDTAPRIITEAKIFGCEVITNDNVLNAQEGWLQEAPERILDTLTRRPLAFWQMVKESAV